MNLYIGTSGYSYKEWLGDFYPATLSLREMLSFYAKHFNSVEINMTFYRTPFPNIVKGWYNKTPDNFKFICKAPRYITHIQRLRTNEASIEKFMDTLAPLSHKLICILWQLPPSLHYNLHLLKEFLSILRQSKKATKVFHCIEFRHKSWFVEKTYEILEHNTVGFCWTDAPQKSKIPKTPYVSTANIVYVRFHGHKELYSSKYPREKLEEYTNIILNQKSAKIVFAFFNNDQHCYAPHDAELFKSLLKPT